MKPNKTCTYVLDMCKMNKSIRNFQFAIDFVLSLLARCVFIFCSQDFVKNINSSMSSYVFYFDQIVSIS